MLRRIFASALSLNVLLAPGVWADDAQGGADALTPGEAQLKLVEGHARFLVNKPERPNATVARRELVAEGQRPFATVLTCSDSRLPAEIIFDQGLGDLFVVRVAGNVADVDEVGSAEFGVAHLRTPVLVVLGHSQCGAVTAVAQNAKLSANVAKLVDNIVPAVNEAWTRLPEGAPEGKVIALAVRLNVLQSMRDLIARSSEVRDLVAAKKLKVVGGVYDLATGGIDWLGEHPRQGELLVAGEAPEASGGSELLREVEGVALGAAAAPEKKVVVVGEAREAKRAGVTFGWAAMVALFGVAMGVFGRALLREAGEAGGVEAR